MSTFVKIVGLLLLSVTACPAQEQCFLRCKLTTSSPGWFTAIRSGMRPSVATRMGTRASIEISHGQDLRSRRYSVSMLPTVDGPGRIRLGIVLGCQEPGHLSREIKTSTFLEEGKPWECTLTDQESGFSLDCQIQGYWTLPTGVEAIRFAPEGEPIYVPKEDR